MSIVRPEASHLVFQLFARPLHPELFQTVQSRCQSRGEYEVRVDLTSSGHLVVLRRADLTLSELTTSSKNPLPQRRQLLSQKLRGNKNAAVEYRDITYQASLQLESLDPEIFWGFQDELVRDGRRDGLLHRYDSGGRLSLGAISYLRVQTRPKALLVQAYHTFPCEYAVAKSQSIFQWNE